MNAYASMIRDIRSQVWAIQPEALESCIAYMQLMAEGRAMDAGAFAKSREEAGVVAARSTMKTAPKGGAVAVLPLRGLITPRGSSMDWFFGPQGTSIAQFTSQLRQAMADPNVQSIVLDIDSPGGQVSGVDELATEIRAARATKKIIAVSNYQCASAAYYLAASCTEIIGSPSSSTGSVGVYCAHEDASEYLAKLGVKVTLIKFGANKAEGTPWEPLSDSARAHMQESVDLAGEMFEKSVAKGRKVSQATVHDTFGQGLVFGAAKAVKLNMIDSVGTLDEVLARFGVSLGTGSTTTMESADPEIVGSDDALKARHSATKRRLELASA